MEDHYRVLGLPHNASLEAIKERYRFLAHAYHPDKFGSPGHKSQAEDEFKRVTQSFKALCKLKESAFGNERHAPPKEEKDPRSGQPSSGEAARSQSHSHKQPSSKRYPFSTGTQNDKLGKRVMLGSLVTLMGSFSVFSVAKWTPAHSVKQETTVIQHALKTEPTPYPVQDDSVLIKVSGRMEKEEDSEVLRDPEFLTATAQVSKGQWEVALEGFKNVALRHPKSGPVHIKIASVLGEKHSDIKAVKSFAQSVVDNPLSADAWLCLADVLNSEGFINEALYAYRKSVQLEPRFEIGWNALAENLDARGLTDEAVGAYQHTIEINSQRAQNWNSLATLFHKQGRYSDAVMTCQKAIDQNAANASTWNSMGVSLMADGKSEEAISAFRQAVNLQPSMAKAWNNLGVGLQIRGKVEEAKTAFLQAKQITEN